jgi:hypothetical protein
MPIDKDDRCRLRVANTGVWIEGRVLLVSVNGNSLAVALDHIPEWAWRSGCLMSPEGPVALLTRRSGNGSDLWECVGTDAMIELERKMNDDV